MKKEAQEFFFGYKVESQDELATLNKERQASSSLMIAGAMNNQPTRWVPNLGYNEAVEQTAYDWWHLLGQK